MRATIATAETYGDCQRKIAWFCRNRKGLYFETGAFFLGSHTSYHVNGNIFRTSPTTIGRRRFRGAYLPIDKFEGWYQLGITMVSKDQLLANSCVKGRDRKQGNILCEISLESIPSDILNLVVELIEPKHHEWLNNTHIAQPPNAKVKVLEFENLWVVVTIIGNEDELLIRPLEDGFQVSHFNSRFSANRKDVEYSYEAYG